MYDAKVRFSRYQALFLWFQSRRFENLSVTYTAADRLGDAK